MKLKCPRCGSGFDLEQASAAKAVAELADVAARLGGCWSLVYEYVDGFLKRPFGVMAIETRLRHAREVLTLWESCEFVYDGRRYRTDKATIRAALAVVCNAQKVGFKNHNYLKSVLLGDSDKMSAQGHTATEETHREEHLVHDARVRGAAAKREAAEKEDARVEALRRQAAGEEPVSITEHKRRRGITSIADTIGRRMD